MRTRNLAIAAAAIAALAIGTLTPIPAVADDSDTIWIDDSDTDAWTYTGPWTHADAAKDPSQWWAADNEGGTESFSDQPGARVTLQFVGAGFRLVGPKGANGGDFRISIDCGVSYPGSSNSGTSNKEVGATLAVFEDLAPTMHTVVIEALGTGQVMIDGVEILPVDDAMIEGRHDGAEGSPEPNGPVELRSPGCGAASSLVEQLKSLTVDGWFGVPGAGDEVWGGVNGHSVFTEEHGVASGPVTIGGETYEAATIPVDGSDWVKLALALEDKPRTLILTVAADETVAQPVLFGVADADGDIRAARVVSGDTDRTVRQVDEMITLEPGIMTTFVVDLRDDSGLGAVDAATVYLRTPSGSPAELDIVEGRTSSLSMEAVSALFGAKSDGSIEQPRSLPDQLFAHGPVVLSRAVADAAAPAWNGDTAVPILIGGTADGGPLHINGAEQPQDSLAITLPNAAWPSSTSSARLQLDTNQRCRYLTASVGLEDSSPSGSSVQLSFLGDGQDLQISHNGTWENAEVPSTGIAPRLYSTDRSQVAYDLRDAKLALGAQALSHDPTGLAAYNALVRAQFASLADTIEDPSMSLMTYDLPGPLVLGSGFNGAYDRAQFQIGTYDVSQGLHEKPRVETITPVNAKDAYPIAVDLISALRMESVRRAATTSAFAVGEMGSPMAGSVEIVVSGTPGATIVLSGAGLDCVHEDLATAVFPLWSQIGVQPPFLPTPKDVDGKRLEMLAGSPLWWDTVCPAGPSTTVGLTFTAVQTRRTAYPPFAYDRDPSIADYWPDEVVEEATAQRPACAFAGDQTHIQYSEFAMTADSPLPPEDPNAVPASVEIDDPVQDTLDKINGDWGKVIKTWLRHDLRATFIDHPIETAVWLAFAPFDLPAAVALNPLLINGLPTSMQTAIGLAFLPEAIVGGVELGIAAGRKVVSAFSRPLESTNGLLLGDRLAFEREAAAGQRLAIETPVGRVSIPVKTVDGEVIADLPAYTSSRNVIASDSVVARMPEVSDHAPWVIDEELESRMVCAGGPTAAGAVGLGLDVHAVWKQLLGSAGLQPRMHNGAGGCSIPGPATTSSSSSAAWPQTLPPPSVPTGGFYARYPQVAESIQTGWRRGPGTAFTTAEADSAFEAMLAEADQLWPEGTLPPGSVAGVPQGLPSPSGGQLIDLFLNVGRSRTRPVVMAYGDVPTYVFSTTPPSEVMAAGGIVGDREGWMIAGPQELRPLDVMSAEMDIWHSPFVRATRDPDLISRYLAGMGQTPTGWWRYRIEKPGIDIVATMTNGGAHQMLRNLAGADSAVQARSGVLYVKVGLNDITNAQELEFLGGQFRVVQDVHFPGYSAGDGSAAHEVAGAVLDPQKWRPWTAKYDWRPQQLGVVNVAPLDMATLDPTAFDPGLATVLFKKRTGTWLTVPVGTGPTAEELLAAGFVRAAFEDRPDFIVWVPGQNATYPSGLILLS